MRKKSYLCPVVALISTVLIAGITWPVDTQAGLFGSYKCIKLPVDIPKELSSLELSDFRYSNFTQGGNNYFDAYRVLEFSRGDAQTGSAIRMITSEVGVINAQSESATLILFNDDGNPSIIIRMVKGSALPLPNEEGAKCGLGAGSEYLVKYAGSITQGSYTVQGETKSGDPENFYVAQNSAMWGFFMPSEFINKRFIEDLKTLLGSE